MVFIKHPWLSQFKIFNSHIILYKKKELTSDKSRPMKQGKVTLCFSFLLV